MDDARRQVLLAELADAKRERANLDAFIEVLSLRLGVAPEPESIETLGIATNGAASSPVALPGQNPVELVYAGEFVGKSWPKATAVVLDRYSPAPNHRPVKTPVLVEALKKGGLDVKTPRQLYRSLYNSSQFVALPGGMWGFATWYPDRVKSKAPKASPEPAAADGEPDLPSDVTEGTNGTEGGAS
jgi:hypothetical protein